MQVQVFNDETTGTLNKQLTIANNSDYNYTRTNKNEQSHKLGTGEGHDKEQEL